MTQKWTMGNDQKIQESPKISTIKKEMSRPIIFSPHTLEKKKKKKESTLHK